MGVRVLTSRVVARPVRVLIVEDDPLDADLEVRQLRRATIPLEHRTARNEAELYTVLEQFVPDIALVNCSLDGLRALTVLRILGERHAAVPIIFVSQAVTEEETIPTMQDGVVDCIPKSHLVRLPGAMLRALDEAASRKQRAVLEAYLKETRDQLEMISAAVDSVLASYSVVERRFVFVSASATKVYGYPAEAFLARPDLWKSVIVPADAGIAREATRRLFRFGHYDVDYRITLPTGETRWVNHRARLVRNESGLPVRVDAVVADITERMEQTWRLGRLSRIRDVLSAVNEAILRVDDRAVLFQEVVRIAYEAGGFFNVALFTIDLETRSVAVEAFLGHVERERYLSNLQRAVSVLETGTNVIPTSLRTRRPAVINDIADVNLEIFQPLLDLGIRAVGSFPLLVAGKLEGAMTFASLEPGYFDEEEVELLTSLARNVSFALERLAEQRRIARLNRIRSILSRVNEAIVRHRDRDQLCREACRIAYEAGGLVNVFVALVDSVERRVRVVAVCGSWEDAPGEHEESLQRSAARALGWTGEEPNAGTAVGKVLTTRSPAVVNDLREYPDVRPYRQLLSQGVVAVGLFPLLVGGELVGFMAFDTDEAGYFDGEEVELLTRLTNDLSFALEGIEREKRVERLSRMRDILSAVNAAIVRVADRAQLLREACRIAYETGGFTSVFAFGLDLEPRRVHWEAFAGGEELWAIRERLERCILDFENDTNPVSLSLRTGKPAISQSLIACDDTRRSFSRLIDAGARAIGSFPLFIRGKVAGGIVFSTRETAYFGDEEVKLLSNLAANLSFALDHMHEQRRVARLSRIRDVLSAVNAAIVRLHDRGALFHEVCRIAVEDGGFRNVFVVEADVESGRFEIVAFLGSSSGKRLDHVLQAAFADPHHKTGAIKTSMISQKPCVKNNLRQTLSDPVDGVAYRLGVRAVGSFPLVLDGRPVGAMVFETDVEDYFDDEEIGLLTNLTNNLAFGLNLLEKQHRVDYLSYYDPLTQLPNRTLFYDRLGQDIGAAKKAGKILALALIDISRFSVLNNTLGEHVGDEVLRRVADRLREIADESRLARVAGDRFALSFPMLDDLRPMTEIITEDGIKLFDSPFRVGGREMHIMARAGCAVCPDDGEDPEALFQNAEAALSSAKVSGTAFRFYAPELNLRLAQQLDLEARLQRAIEERQFVLYYQPKMELGTHKIVGFEALLRWQDPERGLVLPNEFIPLLERTGIIINVGRWVMGEAVRQYEEWRKAGLKPPRIAVNLSAVQLRQERLVDDVRSAVATFSDVCRLDLEVTESMLMENFDAAIRKLDAMRELGVRLSLDDFGTGYSSLSYIHRLPVSALKIDRSFIVGMTEDANKTSIVATIISLAQALKLKVVAEGVEDEAQVRLLQLLRCDEIQGYLVGKPEPAESAVRFLRAAGGK